MCARFKAASTPGHTSACSRRYSASFSGLSRTIDAKRCMGAPSSRPPAGQDSRAAG
jgi:hypothetical protein